MTINFNFKQQLFGPITLGYFTTLNLDSDSEKYNEFMGKRDNIAWNRRSYKAELYYQFDSEAGGIQFSMYGLDFLGSGRPFSEKK